MKQEEKHESKLGAAGRVSRRTLLKSAAILAAARSIPLRAIQRREEFSSGPILAYVGTYTPNGQGIHLFSLDTSNGVLTQVKVAAAVPSPSWLALHPKGTFLYAVNEISNFNGGTTGSVSAFSIDRNTGDLTFLNVVSSQGSGPAHASVDPTGQFVFVANYGGGSIAVLPIQSNGSLGNATDVHVDIGSVGPTKATNGPPGSFAISGHDAPRAHMIESDPVGRFVLHADLGQDRIYSWTLNLLTGKLSPNSTPFTSLPPGDGPRHFAFHPNGQWLYSLQEEASTLVLFDYDPTTGLLTQQQLISALPPGFAGTNFASEVRVSSDGRFVMAANRLHNSVAFFRVDGVTGKLTFVDDVLTEADYPRSFTVDPTGKFLCVCNQRSDVLTTFRLLDGEGHDNAKSRYTPLGSPACIVFLT
jgi:6-phosphogluconolactonase